MKNNEIGSPGTRRSALAEWALAACLVLGLAGWTACRRDGGHVPEGSGQDEHGHLSAGEGAGVSWQKPEFAELVRVLELTGEIVSDPDRSEVVTARIAGRIAEVKADLGQQLSRGDVLFVLDSPELLALKESFIRSALEHGLNRSADERARLLLDQQGIEAKAAEERRTQAGISRAQALAARESLLRLGLDRRQLDQAAAPDAPAEVVAAFMTSRLAVRAPRHGQVLERDLAAGEWVSADKPLFKISDSRHLWGLFDVPALGAQSLRGDAALELSIEGWSGPAPASRILRIHPKIDESTRTVKVRLGIDDPAGRIRPGAFATLRLKAPAGAKSWLVPGEALTAINGVFGVFLREGDGSRFLPLERSERDGAGRLVLPEELANREIATRGVFALKAALLLQSAGGDAHAGHGH